ncbi:MAG: DUF5320 domain-containing protein [Planctomycetes bacterium]|nr:DUF5320 domain-containing protein [Planctomycetota bacterium]
MPGGDGTGPAGFGPMTGRAAGYCAGYSVPGFMNAIPGRGYRGWGRAPQARWGSYAYGAPYAASAPYGAPNSYGMMAPSNELNYLRQQAEYLQTTLDQIQQRIETLEESVESEE